MTLLAPTGERMSFYQAARQYDQEALRVIASVFMDEPELRNVVNSFDPWARDRGEYYSLEWMPRADARADPAFK